MRIAALDQGTTSTRVLVASQDGSADIQLALRHQQHHPQSGWVEHDPLELLANLQRCLEASGRVDAIGLANQSSTFLPLAGLSRPAACAWEPATPGFSTACAEPSPPTSPPPRAPH